MGKHRQLLLVEDDSSLGFIIQDILRNEGYTVHLATDGKEGLKQFNERDYDLCLLDVMMPEKDGFSLARDIRKVDGEVPIIFLTAKGMEQDRVEGFKSGADDYITKPFSEEEFLLRIRAILKRTGKEKDRGSKQIHHIGDYIFDSESLTLTHPSGEKILTKKESALLKLLCQRKGQVVERELAGNLVWGDDSYFVGRSMDVFITKLRKYLKADEKVSITNVHGVGFKLEVAEK
jgi:DNA-binding response OmpR family regulator